MRINTKVIDCFPTARRGILLLALLPALLLAHPMVSVGQNPQAANPDEPAAALALSGAQEAIAREDYDTATTLLESFLFAHPGHAQALFNLAYVYSLQNRPQEAMEVYRQTLEVEPELLPARMNLALLLVKNKKSREADEEFKRILEIDPDNLAAHNYLAAILEQLGHPEEALEHYRRLAELDPQAVEPRQAILRLLLVRKEWEAAEQLLEELLRLSPQEAGLHLLRVQFLSSQGDKARTLAAYEAYFRVAAEDSSASPSTVGEMHMRAGVLARELGQGDEALGHFRAAVTDGGDAYRQVSTVEQAETLAWLERYDEALPLYEQAVAAAPDNLDLLAGLGFVYLQTRQYNRAIPPLAHVVQANPKRVEVLNHLVSALYLSGNLAGAIEALDRRARLVPETPGTLFLRAISYDKLGQCRSAIEYYQKFLDTNPSLNSDEYFQSAPRLRLLKKTCREKERQ